MNQRNRYIVYCIIGGVIGVLTLLARELIGLLLPSDTPVYYGLSVFLVYCSGMILSYNGHRRITFNIRSADELRGKSLVSFILIAITGMLSTTGLSLLLRYSLPIGEMFQPHDATVSFALAALAVSLLTFALNSRFTFSRRFTTSRGFNS